MTAPDLLGGRYELRGVLGRGGMAEVRDGWDTRLHRAVAIKLLHPGLIAQADIRIRFAAEARSAAALSHPNVVAVHDSGEHHGTPFIVMERLSGRSLADQIACGPLAQPLVRSIVDDVLSALAAAHAAGILHRDIKPGNILLTDFGHAKVADFGIAKSVETAHTMTGQIVGTMAYLSAERIAGRPATVSDDLYALGVVGYEALTGRRPFPQQNLAELARAIAEQPPPPLALLRPDVDPSLAATIERAMAHDPQWRFGSAIAMRAALAGELVPVRPPTRVLAAPLPDPTTMLVARAVRPNRTKKLLGLAAVLAALVLAAVLLVFDPGSQPPPPEPASTSTSVPPPTTSAVPPPPTTSPAQVDQGKPGQRKGNRGENGKAPKPKGDDDDD